MTHIPTYVIVTTAEEIEATKAKWDKWANGDISEKYGVKFLTIEEANAEGLLENYRPNDVYSPIAMDEPTRQMVQSLKPKAFFTPPKSRAERRAEDRRKKKKRGR